MKISFDFKISEVSQRSNLQYPSTASDNGLAPTRRQPIIWTNETAVWWRIYVSLGLNDLREFSCQQWVPLTKG